MKAGFICIMGTVLSLAALAFSADDRQARHDQRLADLIANRGSPPTPPRSDRSPLLASDDDILISHSVAPARFSQDRPRVTAVADRGWWVAWDDDRAGSRKIYRQRFDTLGNRLGENELMAGSTAGSNYVDARLGVDTLGRVFFAFRDQTHGGIYAARYAADGSVEWTLHLVNDTSLNSFAGPFDMTVFPDGQMIVVWENYSALGPTIDMKLYSPAGTTLVGPVTVNSDGGSANRWVPSVAAAPGSGFLVVWEDYRHGQADIYARQFTGAGNPVGSDFTIVPPPHSTSAQYSPEVTYSPKDRYVIGWVDLRQGQEIYLQRYDQITGLIGENQLISSGHEQVLNRDLDLTVSVGSQLNVIWSASGADNSIQHLKLDSGLVPAGLPRVLNLTDLGQRWAPSASLDEAGNMTLAWTESVDDDPDIAVMLFDSEGNRRLSEEAVANDDEQGAHSVAPGIIPTSHWWNLVCFSDRRFDPGDIFVRTVSNAGLTPTPEVKVNQDAGASLQAEPALAASASQALVVWNDGRTLGGFSGQRIYGRFGSALGDFVDSEFLISDTFSLAVKASPKAAIGPDGTSLVSWIDLRNGTRQVYGRWLTADGNLDGGEFGVSQPTVNLAASDLFVGRADDGRFTVVWLDAGLSAPAAQVRQFDSDHLQTGSFNYGSPVPGVEIDELAVDIDPDGTIALFWIGAGSDLRVAYLTRLADNGAVISGPTEMTDSPAAKPSEPSVSISDNGYVSMTWIDRRDGRQLAYYQLLASDLSPIGANQPVSSFAPEFMQNPQTDAYRGRAWFVWSDPRANGLNVYARPLIYLPTDIDDDPSPLPVGYCLSQNYPNPFNPITEIEYALPVTSQVRLTVINLLGQTVTTLVDDLRGAGAHRVVWDGQDARGSDVASGVYLYHLQAGDFSHTRKMLLLK